MFEGEGCRNRHRLPGLSCVNKDNFAHYSVIGNVRRLRKPNVSDVLKLFIVMPLYTEQGSREAHNLVHQSYGEP
jgi:hypothetical protein